MRPAGLISLLLAWGAAAATPAAGPPAPAELAKAGMPVEVAADAPSVLAVTVYRAPYRRSGAVDLDSLQGFALVSETRAVHLPAGESRLRFEGVADGIEPVSAIVTGLESGILEKNRDAALLSPSSLVAAAQGHPVQLIRRSPKSGVLERRDATIVSDALGGVVFRTPEGLEALRCSGLPETFSFENAAGLSSRPTLSVRVRAPAPISAQVTLSYLARGFDWAANYTATLAPDGKHMDLGAWVTLANGNGIGFPSAHTQVVAGRVNRVSGNVDPIDLGGPILATCWPRGSTSDSPQIVALKRVSPQGPALSRFVMGAAIMPAADVLQEAVVTARVTQEQLGDLKLYRVPEPTTVASRQSKQVRLLDRSAIPIDTFYGVELTSEDPSGPQPASQWLRTKNSVANHLGLPLPSGSVAVFLRHGTERLLAHQSDLRDLAIDEEVEIEMGSAPDVEVQATHDRGSHRVDITNARPDAIRFELKLRLDDDERISEADRRMGTQNGRPIFRLRIPAQSTLTLHYRTTKSG